MIGSAIGNFEVIRQLGKGGMGEVWLAEHKDIKTKVAIKMLLPQISRDKQQVERFFNEAVAVSKIKHAGITKIFDVGFRPTGEAYLVMEYLEGESLAARIKRVRRLPLAELADIARQIASVLEATHVEGITHRDLKPDNLVLVRDAELPRGERVKVLDFGIAKLSSGTGMTGSGAIGTPLYMSPEQWKTPAGVDGRADVYSLGCLVFEMACGRPPFIAASVGEACTLHLNEPPPSIRSFAQLPAELDTLVTTMLAKLPEQRPSVRDVKLGFAAIEETAEDTGVAATIPGDVAIDLGTAVTAATSEPISARRPIDTTLGAAASMVGRSSSKHSSQKLWPILAGVAVVASGLAVYFAARGGTVETVPTAPAPARGSATAPPPPAPTGSHVHLAATPPAAEIRIDDALVSNPFEGTFRRDDLRHHVVVHAVGFQDASEWLTFDTSIDRTFTLAQDHPKVGTPAKPPVTVATPVKPPAPPEPPVTPTKPIYTGTKGTLITADPSKQP